MMKHFSLSTETAILLRATIQFKIYQAAFFSCRSFCGISLVSF